jgi:hypothetical protein
MAEKGFDKHQIDKINGHLDALIRVSDKEVPKLIKESIIGMHKDVKALAPVSRGVSKGNLKNSIYTEIKDYEGRMYIDTTLTDVRKNGFNYGRVVEHGRAGKYTTTNYFYDPVKSRLSLLYNNILAAIKESFK